MNNCKLRFYNAIRAEAYGKKLDPADVAVLLRSNPHTHVEFQFSERHNWVSFSATMRDGLDCCRFSDDIDYSVHCERWDTLILPLSDDAEDKAFVEAKRIEGQPYLKGLELLSFLSKKDIIVPNPTHWWCGKTVAQLIRVSMEYDGFNPTSFVVSDLFFEMFYRLNRLKGQ
jgi:hypothetical protein